MRRGPVPAWVALLLLGLGGPAPVRAAPRPAPVPVAPGPELVDRVLSLVGHRYVDPAGVDPEDMLQGALRRTERILDPVLLHREHGGRLLVVDVGSERRVLDVPPVEDLDALADALAQVREVLIELLPRAPAAGALEYALLDGALDALDPHSALLRPRTHARLSAHDAGVTGTVGLSLEAHLGIVRVAGVRTGSAAAVAGLEEGDRIVRIDGQATINRGLTDVRELAQGPVGSPVRFEVRPVRGGAMRTVELVREQTPLTPVRGELLDGGVALLTVPDFDERTARDFQMALVAQRVAAGGVLEGVVIDLRGNPGGFVNPAVDIADIFLFSGEILRIHEAGGPAERVVAYMGESEPDVPLLVLTDSETASAAEIVAGVLQARERAWVVGQATFGKGTVQTVYPNPDGSALKLTVAEYILPDGSSIQGRGVRPDVALQPLSIDPEAGTVRVRGRGALRERDLEGTLGQPSGGGLDGPDVSWALRAMAEGDGAVELARRIALASEGAAPEAMAAATAEVGLSWAVEQDAALVESLADFGIDWRSGVRPSTVALDAELQLGEDGELVAGQAERIAVTVHNSGEDALARLSFVVSSEASWLDGQEIVVGALAAGETGRAWLLVDPPPEAFPGPVLFGLRAHDGAGPLDWSRAWEVAVQGVPGPELVTAWTVYEDGQHGSEGDGDGRPEAGETVAIYLDVLNRGPGPTEAPLARLRPRSGQVLVKGTAALGPWRDDLGAPCSRGEVDCARRLEPGESAQGTLLVTLEPATFGAGWTVELGVADHVRIDHSTVVGAGFPDFLEHRIRIPLHPDEADSHGEVAPPRISVARATGSTLSGLIEDDRSIASLQVFLDGDKVAHFGGPARQLPFTVDLVGSAPGSAVTLLARDTDGLIATRTVRLDTSAAEPPTLRARFGGEPAGAQ